jgi:hypothetical protein
MRFSVITKSASFLVLLKSLGLSISAIAQGPYFPKGTFDNDQRNDQFVNEWYSTELKALQEPSLYALAKDSAQHSYRFLWLRTFHQAVTIRLDIQGDGSSILTERVGTGESGFKLPKLSLQSTTTKKISVDKTQAFLKLVQTSGYWSMPAIGGSQGCDGSEWIIEGVQSGKYHLISSWTPSTGPIHDLGTALAFDLAGMKVSGHDIY